MDPTPLAASTLAIQIHAGAAMASLVLGTAVLLRQKGDRLHKIMGRGWAALMLATALSSFAITEIRMFGPYSWIHGLSIFTIFALGRAVWAIRQGDVKGHRSAMVSLYFGALILAGGFTLVPGRRMHAVLFADGGQTATGSGIAVAMLLAGIVLVQRRRGVRLT